MPRPKKTEEPVSSKSTNGTTAVHAVPEELERTLKMLQELRKRLDFSMHDGMAASKGAGINPEHVKLATQLSKAMGDLGRETRAWMKKQHEMAASAPLEEKIAAIGAFYQTLSDQDRREMLDAMGVAYEG